MIAVDTNVLVRLLTRDDEEQFRKAFALIARNEIFIPESVILETEWVLRYAYDFPPAAIHDALAKTLGLPKVKTARPGVVAQAIDLARQGLDFADALHLAASHECSEFATFDAAFIKRAKGLTDCKVRKP
ncbi:MAG: type II toxin-antitoxin system VapC family toxin [Thermodesulfobacteriota bacterium]